MTVAAFRLFRSGGSILEANLSQTVGLGVDLPRHRHDLHDPRALPVGHGAALHPGGGARVPRRPARPLGDDPAAAAADRERPRRAAVPRGHGLRRGAARDERRRGRRGVVERLDLPRHGRGRRREAADLARATCSRASCDAALPVLPKAELALEVAPALLGVGYILGYRQSAVCVAGALISAVTLTPLIAWLGAGLQAPLYPETQTARRRDGRGRRSGRATCATSAPERSPRRGS